MAKRRTSLKIDSAAVRRVIESPKRTIVERQYPYQPYTTQASDRWSLTAPKSTQRLKKTED